MKLNGSLAERIDAIFSKAQADVGRKYIEHAALIYKDAGYDFNDAIVSFCSRYCNLFKDVHLFFENPEDDELFHYDLFADSEMGEWQIVLLIKDAAKRVAADPFFAKSIPLGKIGFNDALFYINEDGSLYGIYPQNVYRFDSLTAVLKYEFNDHLPVAIDYLEEKTFDKKEEKEEESEVSEEDKEYVLHSDDFDLTMKIEDLSDDLKKVYFKTKMDGYTCLSSFTVDARSLDDFRGNLYYACRRLAGQVRLGPPSNFIEFIFNRNQPVIVRGRMYAEGAFKKEFVFAGELALAYVDDFADQLFGDKLYIF